MRPNWTANAPKASRQRNLTGLTPSINLLIGRSQSPAVSPSPLAAYRSMRARKYSTRRVIRLEDSTLPATSSVCFFTITRRVPVRHAMSSSHAWRDGTLRHRGYSLFGRQIGPFLRFPNGSDGLLFLGDSAGIQALL